MDVTVETVSSEEDGDEAVNSKGSGGGCNLIRNEKLEIRSFLIFLLMPAVIFIKRKTF